MEDRLAKLLTSEGISPARLAEVIGVQRSALSHILTGRNKPSFDMIERILNKFPKISAEWLIMGRGEMYKTTIQQRLFDEVTYVNNGIHDLKSSDLPLNSIKAASDSENITDIIKESTSVVKIVMFFEDDSFKVYHSK